MSSITAFRSSVILIWFRLATLGVIVLVFTEALMLALGKAQGWSYYLTPLELWFEVLVRLGFSRPGAGHDLYGSDCTVLVVRTFLARPRCGLLGQVCSGFGRISSLPLRSRNPHQMVLRHWHTPWNL